MKNEKTGQNGKAELRSSERDLSSAPASSEVNRQEDLRKDQTPPQFADKQKEASTQESAEGVSESRVKKSTEPVAAQSAASLPESARHEVAKRAYALPGQKAFTAMAAPQAIAQDIKITGETSVPASFRFNADSVHIRDSIRADSLRKARILDSLERIKP